MTGSGLNFLSYGKKKQCREIDRTNCSIDKDDILSFTEDQLFHGLPMIYSKITNGSLVLFDLQFLFYSSIFTIGDRVIGRAIMSLL